MSSDGGKTDPLGRAKDKTKTRQDQRRLRTDRAATKVNAILARQRTYPATGSGR